MADYHTYFVGDEHWGWAAWAHNAYKIENSRAAVFTDPDTEKKTTRGTRATIHDTVSGYSQTWFIPTGLPAATEAKKEACADNRSGIGAALQTAVNGYNNDWKALPADSSEKYTQDQYNLIRDNMVKLNVLRVKYGLPAYDLNTFLMGGNPDQLPGLPPGADPVQYKADCLEYGRLLRSMNSMRASAQGIYIHNKVKLYCEANGLLYSGTEVDVTAPATAEYIVRHYEVLRDTSGSWMAHYRDSMVGTSWRAITYI